MKKAMIDIAFDILSDKKKALTFPQLWQDVCHVAELTPQQEEDNIAQFYSDLSLDDRFVCVKDNKWDLKVRHTYHEVVIDTTDILIDEDNENEDTEEFEEETEESNKENEEEY